MGSVSGSERSLGRGHGNPLQYSCLENPMVREAWWAIVYRVTQTQIGLKGLSTHYEKKYGGSLCCVCVCAQQLQLCPTLCDPVDYSPPGSSVHGIFPARILEWVGMPSSRASSRPRNQTSISCQSTLLVGFFTIEPPWRFLKNLKIKLPCEPAIPLLGIYLEKTLIQNDTYVPMFIAVLFTVVKICCCC